MNHAFVEDEWNWVHLGLPYKWAHFRSHALTAEAERALKPRDSFRECDVGCPEMIVVPAGEFIMGSPDGTDGKTKAEEGRYDDEGPQHRVVIAHAFAAGINDVTFDEWDACAAVGGCPKKAVDYLMGRGRKPAVGVSFDDAEQYAAWLSLMTGKPYRLLSEAEWEYSARAGTTTAYFWGDEIGNGHANCNGCGSQRLTSPVGYFAPNAFGLHDMAGNVFQWLEDCLHEGYDSAPNDGSAWTDRNCADRMIRGGSWMNYPRDLRSAARNAGASGDRGVNLGFRVARTLAP
jgi:formylglycine-generating enzyme required for sulfatase activity